MPNRRIPLNNKTTKRSTKLKLGPFSFAAVGAVAVVGGLIGILLALFGFALLLSFVTMILLGVLHAEVAVGIPAFGYWASFWITVALGYFGSFFRGSSSTD